jgi:hypothetical protein
MFQRICVPLYVHRNIICQTSTPVLFKPLKRIENAARRATGVLLTAPDVSPEKDQMVANEIQEMRDVLQAFQTAIEVAGLKDGGIRSHLSEWPGSEKTAGKS